MDKKLPNPTNFDLTLGPWTRRGFGDRQSLVISLRRTFVRKLRCTFEC